MGKGKKAAIAIALITLVTAIVGGGSASNWSFDFSTTTIGQIGDNIINNYLEQNYPGIDIDKFKANCDAGEYTNFKEAQQMCELLT